MEKWEGMAELPEIWWSTRTECGLFSRVEAVEEWIASRPEQCLAVVGHGGLFARLVGYHLKNCGFQWVDWQGEKSSSTDLL